MVQDILILGSTSAALQAANDLADCGLQVTLVDDRPFIGIEEGLEGHSYLHNTRLLEILKHPRIKVWTNTSVSQLARQGEDSWVVDLVQQPRYVDLTRCTACGECLEVCPVTIAGTNLKAIHFGGQPACAVITKNGISPCSNACPAGIHVQGYVALTAAGRYQEAYSLIHQDLPFPSVCGRVCNHYCEESCTRAQYDQPVNIMALKRFVTDRVYQEQDPAEVKEDLIAEHNNRQYRGSRIAVVGAGPAGLTAARDLTRAGYPVTVFDANSQPGGMMRVGIPPHRLDYEQLDWEIEQILLEGVELRLNTWVDDIPGLLENGFEAVLIATGAHQALKIGIENADHPDNWLSLDFLKKVCQGEKIDLTGRKVIVLGGGDVAMDAARSAIRLGEPEVRVVCRGMRASFNEIKEAEEEGVQIIRGRVFKKVILEKGRIAGVECLEAEVGEVVNGKRQFSEIPGSEHLIPGDLVIWAVGQRPDFSFLPPEDGIIKHSNQGIQADQSMMTTLEGVYTAGDVRRGTTFFVVDAVGEGHRAARSIMDYLEGNPSRLPEKQRDESILELEDIEFRVGERKEASIERICLPCIDARERRNNFLEVEQTISEKEALGESRRCLACGPCSECMACVQVCEPGAILHSQQVQEKTLNFSQVIASLSENHIPEGSGAIRLMGDSPLAGSAAAYQVIHKLARLPESQAASDQPLDIQKGGTGLVLCQCGGNISNSVDTAGLREEALSWPEISLAEEVPFSCTKEGAESIQDLVREHQLSRIIIAACSCCDLDQVCYSCTYQRVRCKENLGVFSGVQGLADTVFVNIREQCASVHPRSKKKATAAARELIRAALARIPLGGNGKTDYPMNPTRTLIVGEGKSAQVCLGSLEELGWEGAVLEVLSSKLVRTGGRYYTVDNGAEIQADYLVLAPDSGAELDFLSRSVVLPNQTPLLTGENWQLSARDLAMSICSPDEDPELIGRGAAAQIAAWNMRIKQAPIHRAARVDPELCRSCGTCLEVCGCGIPEIVVDQEVSRALINPYLCLGCGVCAAHCPSGAITPGTLSDLELEGVLNEVLP